VEVDDSFTSGEDSNRKVAAIHCALLASGGTYFAEGIMGSFGTESLTSSLSGCREASRLHRNYTTALAAFEKARDRLLAGWNNTRQRMALAHEHAEVERARCHYWNHVENHGCRQMEAQS
jgi:hypothetical protein